jgi:Rhodanese-related sulfurtransferase
MRFETIPAKALDYLVYDQKAFIIDLRPEKEFREAHIKGAVNIPYGSTRNYSRLPKNMILVIYCERGSKSMMMARELSDLGYSVKTVIGGIHAYRGNYLEYYN